MPSNVAGLRYPSSRVLLPRTRLAYVHLRNLLTDAKRDRAARVSGYVAIWLPEEFVTLYMHAGEVVNATVRDADGTRPISIAGALEMVPAEPEYGDICFHEASEEQLGCMFAAQTVQPEPWPAGLTEADPSQLFPFLVSTTFDGSVEILAQDTVNYLVFRDGSVERAFLAASHHGTLVDRVAKLFAREGRLGDIQLRKWAGSLTLPAQAPPALVQAYRDLTGALVHHLVELGRESAPAVAQHARNGLLEKHPELQAFSFDGSEAEDPLADTAALTAAVASLVQEVVWATADHDQLSPEGLLKDITWERRHMFQSAGLFEKLPWKIV